ncbi:MAG TPA: sensor histidine kinase [Bacillus sp. (in: firmicutes)]|nr:sensor histidine kinase [Bacillus sp. (in: firmicutes)]
MFRNAKTSYLPKRNLLIIVGIAIASIIISIYSYDYYNFTSNKITDIALHEIKTNNEIQVHDLSQILANKFESVKSLLQTLADSPAIHNNEYNRAYTIINTRQNSTNQITDFYMWLDKNGKINWISDMNNSLYQKYKGTDLSYRSYFSEPKVTHVPFYSSLIESNDKIPRLYISYPVLNFSSNSSSSIFTGVVVASMRATTMGDILQNQLLPQFNSSVGLLDKNGIVLYSSASSLIGKYIFAKDTQSILSSLLTLKAKTSLNALLNRSLEGGVGSADISSNNFTSTISYEPVNIANKYFMTLYVISPHKLASDVGFLINQQKYFSTILIFVIASVALGTSLLVFTWNKRLKIIVDKKTAELKEANDQLKIHDKMQNEFINIASHEIKTPTQSILSYSELLQRHPEKNKQITEAIVRNAKRLQRLTNDILDVTKIESQSLKLTKEKFNLNDVIFSVVEDFNNTIRAEGRNIKIFYEYKEPIILDSDKGRMSQVISNILSNAIKFSSIHDGKIFIFTEIQDFQNVTFTKQVLVSIKDEGIGIDNTIIPRLFSKFVTKSENGIGLGLYISKNIIEAHGGKIWAENNIDGKGATFNFTIPFLPQ